ncbi:MAG: hypothetical protein V4509_00105 [Patescibacteria group bacterium]
MESIPIIPVCILIFVLVMIALRQSFENRRFKKIFGVALNHTRAVKSAAILKTLTYLHLELKALEDIIKAKTAELDGPEKDADDLEANTKRHTLLTDIKRVEEQVSLLHDKFVLTCCIARDLGYENEAKACHPRWETKAQMERPAPAE